MKENKKKKKRELRNKKLRKRELLKKNY